MKKCINRRISSAALALLVLLLTGMASGCGSTSVKEGFYLEKYGNADAKFFGDYIITSVDEGIQMMDFSGKVVHTYEGLNASWVYALPGEQLIIYSNHDNETHLMRLKDNLDLEEDKIIFQTDLLAIDPTIIRAGDTYLATYTTIDGTINNPCVDGDNGTYTVELFASEDLENWNYQGKVVTHKQDVEDIDLLYEETSKILRITYEKEDYDKGPSQICTKYSEDLGMTWSEEAVLLPNVADNEPADLLPSGDGYRLYYSSDYECVGESYNGASAYYAELDQNFQVLSTYNKVDMEENYGVRLYEVKETEGKLYFLYAHNFMTDKDFVLRIVDALAP